MWYGWSSACRGHYFIVFREWCSWLYDGLWFFVWGHWWAEWCSAHVCLVSSYFCASNAASEFFRHLVFLFTYPLSIYHSPIESCHLTNSYTCSNIVTVLVSLGYSLPQVLEPRSAQRCQLLHYFHLEKRLSSWLPSGVLRPPYHLCFHPNPLHESPMPLWGVLHCPWMFPGQRNSGALS